MKKYTLTELPEDVIFEIIAKIPPKFLHETLSFVNKAWYKLICSSEFIDKNASHHKPGILIQVPKYRNNLDKNGWKTTFLKMVDKQELEFSLTNSSHLEWDRSGPAATIWSILRSEPTQQKTSILCVKNSLTISDVLTLPNCPSGCKHWYGIWGCAPRIQPYYKGVQSGAHVCWWIWVRDFHHRFRPSMEKGSGTFQRIK